MRHTLNVSAGRQLAGTKARAQAHREAVAARNASPTPAPLLSNYLNTAPDFWPVYAMQQGARRRLALLKLFQSYPHGRLPVNNRHQANLLDPDLAVLLKQGALSRTRPSGFGGLNSGSSSKKQTYLELA
ncbi:MAG: hypothetical protein JWQ11_3551 [Rhizobacter sp.]|nr:hypothetical protein [Rhizobacter sp.]